MPRSPVLTRLMGRAAVLVVGAVAALGAWTAAGAMLGGGQGAAAVGLRETPLDTWETVGLNSTSTLPDWDVLVWDFAEIDGVMYVGGRFTRVRQGSGYTEHDQAYLAAFDVATGDWISTFRPTLDDGVYSLAASPDGSRLLVGGEFTNVNGEPLTHSLAALDPVTGEVDPGWAASVTHESQQSTVMDIETYGDDVYIGGTFTHVDAPSEHIRRYRIARLDGDTGAVDLNFDGRVFGGRVFDMAIPPDGSRLYLGGFFGEINGVAGTKWFGAVDLATGQTTFPATDPIPPNANRWVFALEATDDLVFIGTEQHRYHAYDAATLSEQHESVSNGHGGDYQAMHIADDGVLYAGGHHHGWEHRLDGQQPYNPVSWITAYDTSTGDQIPEWIPTLSMSDGVWTLQTDSLGRLWAGGDPTIAGKQKLRGFAVFPNVSPDDDVNLARSQVATQSSSGPTDIVWRNRTAESRCPGGVGEALRAVDGKTSGGPWECSFSSTLRQDEPWWEVDLGVVGDVDVVRVWNMTQGDTTWEPELDDAHVFVSETPFTGTTVAELVAEPGVWHGMIDGVIDIYEDVTPDVPGRYVRVALEGADRRLRLAEVQVLDQEGDTGSLLAEGATWRYLDDADAPLDWASPAFDDSNWSEGPAQLGFGDGDEATVTASGRMTTYFRTTFEVDDPTQFNHVALDLVRDDGAAVFLNGTEVVRSNLPGGPIGPDTPASTSVWGADERDPQPHQAPASLLVAGTNTLAVEMHNSWAAGPDLSMSLSARGRVEAGDTTAPSAPTDLDAPDISHDEATLTWTAATDDNAVVGYEIFRDGASIGATSDLTYTDTGLAPDTIYRYTVTAVDPSGNSSAESGAIDVTTASAPVVPLVEVGSSWRFLDTAAAPAGWQDPGFDDSGWATGNAELGFGDGDEATLTAPGRVTTYFRTTFDVTDPATINSLALDLLLDDAAVIYINGTEVFRDNLPAGPIDDTTPAVEAIWGAPERTFTSYLLNPAPLIAGTNTLAVEVHNTWSGGGDLSFNLGLDPSEEEPPPPPLTPLVEVGSSWRFLDTAAAPAGWQDPGFDDSGWATGNAELGFGDGDEATLTAPGRVTTYFRTTFDVTDPATINSLALDLLLDDAAVIYINGTEVFRDNLPAGPIDDTTPAVEAIWGAPERTFTSYLLNPAPLIAGTNTLAVEVHNTWSGGGDLSFNLGLEEA